ncbi:MAG: histone deacetylase family protein [Desulfobacterales bacterium]|nr:histone deacetylase family protein [Desulfobacterales bacterium]
MKVVFHDDFYQVYSSDPASAPGRMEPIVEAIRSMSPGVEFVAAEPATEEQIKAAHTDGHVEDVRGQGVYAIAALAAGGAIQAARVGLDEPAFALIRPPGHHASSGSAWGFCYFNNMSAALLALKNEKRIENALVLDIDLHFGDGNVNILEKENWVTIHNPSAQTREAYLREVEGILSGTEVDIIGVSAGFDHHVKDWGGLLATEDYTAIARMVRERARASGGGCFGVLEGGYNHAVLGQNVVALLEGLSACF